MKLLIGLLVAAVIALAVYTAIEKACLWAIQQADRKAAASK